MYVHACARNTRQCVELKPFPSHHLCVNCFVTFLHLHIHPQQQTTASVTRTVFLSFNPALSSPSISICPYVRVHAADTTTTPPPQQAHTHVYFLYV